MFRLCHEAIIRNRLTKYRRERKKALFVQNVAAYTDCIGMYELKKLSVFIKPESSLLNPPLPSPQGILGR